jgi:hypothetical protein
MTHIAIWEAPPEGPESDCSRSPSPNTALPRAGPATWARLLEMPV